MICAVCHGLNPDLFFDVESFGKLVRFTFHSSCAICAMCNKPDSDQVGTMMDGITLVFTHEKCCFTPEQLDTLLKMQREYKPE